MEQLQHLKKRTTATKQLFHGPVVDDEPEFMLEEEQAELIASLRTSNERANDSFKFVLQAFSVMEIVSHLAFSIYTWTRTSAPIMDHSDPLAEFRQSASPVTATLFSLCSFGIGMFIIRDPTRIARDSLAVWTFCSATPLALMMGATEFSFESLWWAMPLLLQILDLFSLWVMQDPEEDFFNLERSQYKLKGA